MAIFLQDIYEETKDIYGLKLICGSKGLQNRMRWVYISEDTDTSAFLNSGELIITTGVNSTHQKDWLKLLIQGLIKQNTCGLIINTGKYLYQEDITPDIQAICEKADYPLFIMPWETHIYDITHDYYNRIFVDTEIHHQLDTAFSNIIYNPAETTTASRSLTILSEHGYTDWTYYTICYLAFTFQSEDYDKSTNGNLLTKLEEVIRELYSDSYLLSGRGYYLLILPEQSENIKRTQLTKRLTEYRHLHSDYELYMGIGSTVYHINELAFSFLHSQAAMKFAKYKKEPLYAYDDMGFYKLLLSVSDTKVLKNYLQEQLGALLEYDKAHHSNYTETLYYYLLYNGSIQKIAEALFCHRNTINYRIRIIKEDLRYNLEDSYSRFQLFTAFQIREYLSAMNSSIE